MPILLRLIRRAGRDDLLRHGSLLSVATVASTLVLFVFNAYMARALGPEVFGELGALLAISAMVSQVGNAMQLTVSRQVSRFSASGDYARLSALMVNSAKLLLVVALAIVGVLLVASPLLSDFLHIPTYLPIILLGISTAFYMVLPAFTGALQGMQRFVQLGINRVMERIVLLAAGVALVTLGLGLNGVMVALGIAGVTIVVLAILPLRGLLARTTGLMDWKDMALPSVPVLVTVLCISALSNLDFVVAKHFLSPTDAGLYSAIARTGKVIFFTSLAFSRVLFPKASQAQALGKSTTPLVIRGLAYVGAFCLVCIAFAVVAGKPAMEVVFGGEYAQKAGLLPWYFGAVSLLSVSTVMMHYNMSISSNRHLVPVVGALVLQLLLMAFFHSSPFQIMMDLVISLAALFAAVLALLLVGAPRVPQLSVGQWDG